MAALGLLVRYLRLMDWRGPPEGAKCNPVGTLVQPLLDLHKTFFRLVFFGLGVYFI